MKISIKREQNQASLSFAERKNRRSAAGGKAKFRPQVKNKLLLLLVLLLTAATGAWATTPNSIVINGTPQVGDKSISLTYHFDPNNVPGILPHVPTLKVKCAADNKWDETLLSPTEVSSGTTNISLNTLGEFEAGKTYEVCFAYNNGNWVDEVFQSFVPAASGVPKHLITATYREQTRSLEQPLPYATTIGELYEAVTGEHFSDLISTMSGFEMPLTGISSNNTSVVSIGELNGASTPVTVIADGKATISINFGSYAHGIFVSAISPLYANMKSGVKDADKWTVKVGEGEAQALPIGGLKGDGSETVTLQYTGRLKVKGVKATSDEKPAEALPALSITSPSVGQVIGSDGKNYAYGSLPTGVTAVAKICYVSGSNGLALALTDEGYMDWSKAQTTCVAHTPAFTGGTWKLASNDEWDNMITAAGSYTALRDGFSSVGGTNMLSAGYWSSTESNAEGASFYFFDYGYWSEGYKDSDGNVARACLAFTVEQAAKEPATVTTAPTGAAVVGVGKTTALVSGGVADGGTMMYKVTTENTKPASTDGFSDAVPTAQGITASGKVYVWYYVKGDDTHTDSEIAAAAIEVPVADVVWDATNVTDLEVVGDAESYTKEGITLSGNTENLGAAWYDSGDPTTDGISLRVQASGGFTFTAPTGKKFTKIEMNAVYSNGWDGANLGTGWTFVEDDPNNIYKATWKGSASSTVDLLTGTDSFDGEPVKSIAFYLSE